MSKEYLEAFGLVKRTCELYIETTRFLKGSDIIANQIKEALNTIQNRLEDVDNANPSEALKCLEDICKILNEKRIDVKWLFNHDYNTIKQALLKAQYHNSTNIFKGSKKVKIEIPESSLMDYNPVKHYLKWEDLEFNHTPKMIDVKMNGNKYRLVVDYNVAGKNLAILRDGKKEYYFLECDKQFFNDLHLERVEE